MNNVININKNIKDGRMDQYRKCLRKSIYDSAVEIEKRCLRLKENAMAGDRDAFLWSNISILYKSLGEMNETVNKLIDGYVDDIDGDQDDWDSESQDTTE